ncbi:MAG: hypothetical protein WC119_02230 [Synergistaceae bacterium]
MSITTDSLNNVFKVESFEFINVAMVNTPTDPMALFNVEYPVQWSDGDCNRGGDLFDHFDPELYMRIIKK